MFYNFFPKSFPFVRYCGKTR